jgi:hypothetical protein
VSNAQLMASIKKHPTIVVCAVLALLAGLIIYFRFDQLDESLTELEAKEKEGGRLAANLRNAANLQEQIDSAQSSIKEINGRMMRVSHLASNLQFFYQGETATGVRFTDVHQTSISKAPAKDTYQPIGFGFTTQGTSRQIMEVLRYFEKGDRYCRVISATVSVAGGDPTGDTLNLNILLEILGLP